MDDRDKELLSTYRAEAASLFAANQSGRMTAERVVPVIVSITAVAIAVGVNAKNDDVALALPPVVLMLVAYMFNQYADLTVLGKARELVESRIEALLGEHALFYETAVAGVRKHGLLVWGVRALQGLTLLVVVAIVAVGTKVAFQHHVWYLHVGYAIATGAALITALLAFAGMRKSGELAYDEITAELPQLGPTVAEPEGPSE